MRRPRPPKPYNRDGIWYLVKRVPAEFAHLDKRGTVKISTEIAVAHDPRALRAGPAVAQLDRELEAYWRGLRDGRDAEARSRFEAAQRRAREVGMPYRTAEELAEGPLEEILRRMQVLIDRNALEDEALVAAVAGGEPRPKLRLSDLVQQAEELSSLTLAKMSEKQRHRWRLPKLKAVANFTSVLGEDKELVALTRDDGIRFRNWLQDRVINEGIKIATANKDLTNISAMIGSIEKVHNFGIPAIVRGLRLPGETEEEATRAAFTTEWLVQRIFAPGALDGLNPQARALLFLVPNTGLRPSEAAGLLPQRIILDHDVPHVQIRADGRKLKTPQSQRDVPLVGMALWVMKLFPEGFPRYRDNTDTLSATINKYLKQHGMLPTDDHSLYSIRHWFEDQLTALEAPERISVTLMGHKYKRPKYGEGPSLEQLRRWIAKFALKAPQHFGPRE